jgi:hypothetical protein
MKVENEKQMKKEKNAELPVVTTLAELKAIAERPLVCKFMIDDGAGVAREVNLAVRRVTPAIEEQRRAILRGPTPPYIKERSDYDHLNAAYRAARDQAEDVARSLVVYQCCPEVAAGNAGLTDPNAIHGYVKNLLLPTILEMIALTALAGGLNAEVKSRANFTSTPASED